MNLLINWPEQEAYKLLVSNKKYFVDSINSSKAYQFTCCYHYSGIGFKKAQVNLGVFDNETKRLVGVLQWGVSAQENIRLDRYVQEPIKKEEYLELNRFCMADSEGRNSESQAISLGIKWLKKNRPDIKLLVSYAGRKEGNYGYIYQATNWEYLGYFISNGFWSIDGKEKHSLTIYYTYNKYGNTQLPMIESICEMYRDVRQTWSKQFIYIQRLDSSLTVASPVLPYPKKDTDFPIQIKEKVYKQDPNNLEDITYEELIDPGYYYEPDELAFSKRTMIRKGLMEKEPKKLVVRYSISGEFEKTYKNFSAVTEDGYSNARASTAVQQEKMYKDKYWRLCPEDEEPEMEIEVPYLCEIDGIKYYKSGELIEEFGVSRQAIQQAKAKKQKALCGHPVNWA